MTVRDLIRELSKLPENLEIRRSTMGVTLEETIYGVHTKDIVEFGSNEKTTVAIIQ